MNLFYAFKIAEQNIFQTKNIFQGTLLDGHCMILIVPHHLL